MQFVKIENINYIQNPAGFAFSAQHLQGWQNRRSMVGGGMSLPTFLRHKISKHNYNEQKFSRLSVTVRNWALFFVRLFVEAILWSPLECHIFTFSTCQPFANILPNFLK